MTLRQRIRFYQQMAVLVRAGVPLRASLTRLKAGAAGSEVAILAEKINAGERIGDAFAAARFSPFECNLVIAGERSAQLDPVFTHLAQFWTRELEFRQALPRPLIYPIVVLHLVVIMLGLLDFLNAPWPVVLAHFLERMALLYGVGLFIYFFVRASWSSPLMRSFWLRVPFIGRSLKAAYAYRWITALKIEFTAGISLSRAVGDAWRASGYVGCDRLAEEAEQAMREKADLSELVRGWRQLPRDWSDFIQTGEISGAFEEAFQQLELEAAQAWTLAQQRVTEWVPKIAYFVVLLVAALMVGKLMYKVEVAPIINVENQIDNATR